VGPVIGVAFDGLGYGTDGTLWGGEFLLADLATCERVGHLTRLPMPGGAAAIRQPWRMAAAYLAAAYPEGIPDLPVATRHAKQWDTILAMARGQVNSPLTSSVGRLFDAVAAVLGVRDEISYEGQAAIELEQAALPDAGTYIVPIHDGPTFTVDAPALMRAVVHDVLNGVPAGRIATRMHHGLADAIVAGCERLRHRSGLATVALSGGVFQNLTLLSVAVTHLEAAGFAVLRHRQVPTNDGGISLGQAVIANH
jgi:hydrogenase maturation protein HypF